MEVRYVLPFESCVPKPLCIGFIIQLKEFHVSKVIGSSSIFFLTLAKTLALKELAIKIFIMLIKSVYRNQNQKLREIQTFLIPFIRSFPVPTLFQLPTTVHLKLWNFLCQLSDQQSTVFYQTLALCVAPPNSSSYHSPLIDYRFEDDDFWGQWLRITTTASLSRGLCLAFYVWEVMLDWVESWNICNPLLMQASFLIVSFFSMKLQLSALIHSNCKQRANKT